VIGRPDPVLGGRVHAVVVPRGPDVAEAELKQFCAIHLSDYKVPDAIGFMPDALPRNAKERSSRRTFVSLCPRG
jgi:long-chain acyl-CoA synthetase